MTLATKNRLVTSPSFAGLTLEWYEQFVPESQFDLDDDAFDAQIRAERLGGPCDRDRLAELLGVAPGSIWNMVNRGHIPGPDHYEEGPSGPFGVWTALQAVAMLDERLVKA